MYSMFLRTMPRKTCFALNRFILFLSVLLVSFTKFSSGNKVRKDFIQRQINAILAKQFQQELEIASLREELEIEKNRTEELRLSCTCGYAINKTQIDHRSSGLVDEDKLQEMFDNSDQRFSNKLEHMALKLKLLNTGFLAEKQLRIDLELNFSDKISTLREELEQNRSVISVSLEQLGLKTQSVREIAEGFMETTNRKMSFVTVSLEQLALQEQNVNKNVAKFISKTNNAMSGVANSLEGINSQIQDIRNVVNDIGINGEWSEWNIVNNTGPGECLKRRSRTCKKNVLCRKSSEDIQQCPLKCQDGYKKLQGFSTCVKLYKERLTVADALRFCEGKGQHRVFVGNKMKHDAIVEYLKDEGAPSSVLIDGIFENGQWKNWEENIMDYLPWLEGQPDDADPLCIHVTGSQYMFGDLSLSDGGSRTVMCETSL